MTNSIYTEGRQLSDGRTYKAEFSGMFNQRVAQFQVYRDQGTCWYGVGSVICVDTPENIIREIEGKVLGRTNIGREELEQAWDRGAYERRASRM